MFTGIIQAIGDVKRLERRGGDLRLVVATGKLDLADVHLGDSIATSGVCLTVIESGSDWFAADVSQETLAWTTLGALAPGQRVNLEKALALGERLGGHLVAGHVDGVAEVVARVADARSVRLRVRAPADLARYIARKCSVCIDGTSLTVNAVDGAEFELNIIPATLRATIFDDYRPATRVNLEVDLIARYLERLALGAAAAVPAGGEQGVTRELLARNGFGSA